MSGERAEISALALDGDSMDYVCFGRGERPMVMLPGLNIHGVRETGYALAHMYRLFAEDYRVYVLDRRDAVPAGCTIQMLAADAARAMDALSIRQADVLGVSQGGMMALCLALARPELVRKMALAVTLSRANDTLRQADERWIALAEQGDYDGLVWDVMQRTYSPAFLNRFGALLPAVSRMRRPASLERFVNLARCCLSFDVYDRLGEIRCPALVLGGREDKIVTGQASEELAAALGCQLYMYEGLGHGAYEEAGDFNDRVLAFFRAPLASQDLRPPRPTNEMGTPRP